MHDFIYAKIHFYDNKPCTRPGRGQAYLNWWLMLILFSLAEMIHVDQKNIKKLCYTSEKVNELRKSLFQHPRMTNQQGTKSWGWTWVRRGPIALKSKNIWLHIMGLRAASDQDIAKQGLRLIVEIDAIPLNGWSWELQKVIFNLYY